MARLQIVDVTIHDIVHVGHHMRAADVRELQAVHGLDVNAMDALSRAVAVSTESFALVAPDDHPVAIFGVAQVFADITHAAPWLLGTEAFARYPRDLVVLGRQVVDGWARQYRQLSNCVDARNVRSVAWLKALGFEIHPPGPVGRAGEPFHLFTRQGCT